MAFHEGSNEFSSLPRLHGNCMDVVGMAIAHDENTFVSLSGFNGKLSREIVCIEVSEVILDIVSLQVVHALDVQAECVFAESGFCRTNALADHVEVSVVCVDTALEVTLCSCCSEAIPTLAESFPDCCDPGAFDWVACSSMAVMNEFRDCLDFARQTCTWCCC